MAWRFWRSGGKLPAEPSPEDVQAMRRMAAKRKPVVLLRPRRAAGPLPVGTSKMGGSPDLPAGAEWPQCPFCKVALNFVMQLFERDFPEFPFPKDASLASLFRCPRRRGCGSRDADRFTAWRFFPDAAAGALAPRSMPRLPDAPTVIPKRVLEEDARAGRTPDPEFMQRL